MESEELDSSLVGRCQADGDEDAFKLLFTRYCVSVHRLCCSILGSSRSAEADDVMQEVFMRVHAALPAFRNEAKFSTWLFRVAYNCSLSYKMRSPQLIVRLGTDRLTDIRSKESDPATACENSQLRSVLNSAIDRLPTEYQVAVRLYYWFDFSVSEIAVMLSTPDNTIKSYLHRARKLLAVDLKRQEGNL